MTRIVVIDCETTGLDPEHDRVCEVAVPRSQLARSVPITMTLRGWR